MVHIGPYTCERHLVGWAGRVCDSWPQGHEFERHVVGRVYLKKKEVYLWAGFEDYIGVVQLAIQVEGPSLGKCTVIKKKNVWNKLSKSSSGIESFGKLW